MNNLIASNIRRTIDLTGGPVNITVPAGQVIEIIAIRPISVTAGVSAIISINGRSMLWTLSSAAFYPLGVEQFGAGWEVRGLIEKLRNKIIPLIAVEGEIISFSSADNTGTIQILYRVHTLASGLNSQTPGGSDSKERTIFTQCVQTTSVGAGLTSDIQLVTNSNPPGETVWPYAGNVPPQREYDILALLIGWNDTVGTNLTRNGVRLLLEGREQVSATGIVTAPTVVAPLNLAAAGICVFPEPLTVNSFEQVQIFMRVTSTDVGAQNALLYASLLCIEKFLK